jgi:hypothetical protein
MRILLLKRGGQPVGLHAARQGRLRALSRGGDLESVTLTSVKIYPESRRFWPRFPLCADSVILGPILGQLTAHGWIPIRADACRRIWELRSASTLHLDVAAYHIGKGWFTACRSCSRPPLSPEPRINWRDSTGGPSASCARHRLGERTQKRSDQESGLGARVKGFVKQIKALAVQNRGD